MNKNALFAALLWGLTPAVAKLVLFRFDNFQLLFYFTFISVISLGIFYGLPKVDDLRRSKIIGLGVLGIFVYHVLFFAAIKYSLAQESSVTNYTWPIWVVIFAALLYREKFGWGSMFGIMLSFVGVCLLLVKSVSASWNGIAFGLLGAVSYGLFSVLGRKYGDGKYNAYFFLLGFLLSVPTLFIFSSFIVPNVYELLGLLWLGISNAFGFVFWFRALKSGKTAQVSNIMFLTPVISFVAIAFIGESIRLYAIFGLVLVLAGIGISHLSSKR